MATEPVITGAPTCAPSTRRDLLAGVGIAAAALPATALAAPVVDCTEWNQAMRRYYGAHAAYERFRVAIWKPANEREVAFEEAHGVEIGPGYFEKCAALTKKHGAYKTPGWINEEIERLSEAEEQLEAALMAMPAPNGEALAWKLRRAFGAGEDDDYTPSWSREYLQPTIDDIHRLACGGAN